MLGLAVVLSALASIYVPHVQRATFVYEDASLLTAGGGFPGWRAVMTRGRGLTRESWRHIRTPQASHALNLVLHLLVSLLAGVLIWQVTGWVYFGLSVAAIVVLHPLAIETVAYAASRAELIAACGGLLALVGLTARAPIAAALIPVGLLIAYTGKETGLVALGLMPLVLWLAGARRQARQLLWAALGAMVLFVGAGTAHVGGLLALGETTRVRLDATSWLLMQAEAVYRLVVLSVAPFWLSVSPNITRPSWAGVAALILLAGLLDVAWRCRMRAPMCFAGIVWCAVVAAPRFLIRTPLSPFNEHQWYLALPGVALVLVAGIDALARAAEAWLDQYDWEMA